MTLRIHPTYRNRSLTSGDRLGAALIDLIAALVSTGHWVLHGCGDGNAALATAEGVSIFTGNGGLGYQTSTTGWTSSGANANLITHARAWFRMRERVGGVFTGREFMVQRSSDAGNFTGADELLFGYTVSGFGGTPTANSPYPTGTYVLVSGTGAFNGAGRNLMGTITNPPRFNATQKFVWHVWTDDGTPGVQNVCPWALAFYSRTDSDLGFGMFVFDMRADTVPAAESHPLLVGCSTWTEIWGGDNASPTLSKYTSPLWLGPSSSTTVRAFCYSSGAWAAGDGAALAAARTPSPLSYIPSQSGTAPTVTGVADADGAMGLWPISVFGHVGAATKQRKGVLKGVHMHWHAQDTDLFPRTLNADLATTKPPKITLGSLVLPWEVGLVPDWASNSNSNSYTELLAEGVADSGAPVFGAFTPAAGAIPYNQAITIPVTDAVSGVSAIGARVQFADRPEAVFAFNGATTVQYDTASGATAITNGFSLTILRDGGWLGDFSLTVEAEDNAGNSALSSAAYTITGPNPAAPDTTAPVITLVSPASLVEISRDTEIEIEIDDGVGTIELFVLFAVYPSIHVVEVVLDGGDLSLETAYTVTPSIVDGKQRYRVVRAGGWPADGYLRARAIDTAGNQSS